MLDQATKTFSKMHARRNPNLSIQSTAPFPQFSPRVQSSTSSSFLSPTIASRRGLLPRSPPVSPSLPSLIPRHGKKQIRSSRSVLVRRAIIGCCGGVFVLWIILRHLYSNSQQAARFEENGDDWEMVGGMQLPQEPSTIAVRDAQGEIKWTVSIPSRYDFPLQPSQYRDICQQATEVSKEVLHAQQPLGYNQRDKHYLDVTEAEEQTLLPLSKATGRPKGFVEDESIADGLSITGLKTCERSLTFVMETENSGFGNTLMRMWMSYGLAKAENRAFFVDDTRWPYGKYKSFFQPPPSPGCLPPSKTHMVPCPQTARHIVVSDATIMSTFGQTFANEWEDTSKTHAQRQRKIFALLRTGYQALFKLRTDDEEYIVKRADELYGDIKEEGGLSVGMHIRRGDKHPMEYQYEEDYIPLARYIDTAHELYASILEGKSKISRDPNQIKALLARHSSSKMIIASDDPTMYQSPELGHNNVRAQDRIALATKATLEAAQGKNKKNRWIDEITGWEGGFFRDVFLSLGQTVGNAKDMHKLDHTNVPETAMQLRELVGRAYLMDLAVLGQADTVVCTISSTTCRLLAVMMGWDKAVVKGRWRNVDGNSEWTWRMS